MERNNRREFLKKVTAISTGLIFAPDLISGSQNSLSIKPLTRKFGKINFQVTTMGLGGQASLQWTPPDVDPVKIIEKAFRMKLNYFDTSNVYGQSQLNYGKAFRKLNLIPGEVNYNKELRDSIFLTSKSGLRLAKGYKKRKEVKDMTEGDFNAGCVGDLKRSLSQIFGDGKGYYPEGSYLNLFLLHNVETMEDVETAYKALDNPSPEMEEIGFLAAITDYRDGTNKTGLNPQNEKLIRHIGFSAHKQAPVIMEMIQRDTNNILDALLLPINSNDLLYRNMQYNVLPLTTAKNMGVIAMKVFANGLMYGKKNRGEVIRTVGNSTLQSELLIKYTLATPGVHTVIIGIGEINDDYRKCQLVSNLNAAQIKPGVLSAAGRKDIENSTSTILGGKTNDFQSFGNELTPPKNVNVEKMMGESKKMKIAIRWDNALSGTSQISHYEIYRDSKLIATYSYKPQISKTPFSFIDVLKKGENPEYIITVVDINGNKVSSEPRMIS